MRRSHLKVIPAELVHFLQRINGHLGVPGASSIGVGGFHPQVDGAIGRTVPGNNVWVTLFGVPDDPYYFLLHGRQAFGDVESLGLVPLGFI